MYYVFGYGSLVNPDELAKFLNKKVNELDYQFVRINGFERNWSVAMDNNILTKGYKYYVDSNNQIPNVKIAFLNLVKKKSSSVYGILFKVTEKELRIIDKREKNYIRKSIKKRLPIDENEINDVFIYVSSRSGKKRFEEGKENGNIYIQKDYLNKVLDAYKKISINHMIEFVQETDFMGLKIIELKRIEN